MNNVIKCKKLKNFVFINFIHIRNEKFKNFICPILYKEKTLISSILRELIEMDLKK